jgi:signal transduction histidine kinase
VQREGMSLSLGADPAAGQAPPQPGSTELDSDGGRGPLPDLPTVLDRDRRSGTERAIELARWIVLIFAGVSVNLGNAAPDNQGKVDVLLGCWAVFNLLVTGGLLTNHLPSRRLQLLMLGLDITVASGIVYLTGGLRSDLGVVFYLVIITSSLRFGLTGSLVCAATVSALFAGLGLAVDHGHFDTASAGRFASTLFLFFAIALTSGLLAQEMVRARARQLTHTYELETITFNELREVDRIKSEFMMLASHELRTPLTKIKAWISLMQDAGDRLPPAARDEGIRELRAETEHLARLTDNLLCIAQLESGEIRLKTSLVELDAVIHATISRFIESADRTRFAVAISPDAARALADPERLALVLACLVDNALKFSPDGEQVQIITQRQGRKVRLEVHDNGRRIPDSEVERVFASFYQVESPLLRQRGGFGVGLYLSRQLIERMGGRIWIDNARARGNSFVIGLPTHT